ncbi:MAG: hypothetical protein BWY84_01090 [Candidatus Aerophobetes bacterium ADurb.Bin490]|nr:MAG: hypothetical protein BWY84_01090 [Candidatus Aerophobetes bacterium ADurb.Bin490]
MLESLSKGWWTIPEAYAASLSCGMGKTFVVFGPIFVSSYIIAIPRTTLPAFSTALANSASSLGFLAVGSEYTTSNAIALAPHDFKLEINCA